MSLGVGVGVGECERECEKRSLKDWKRKRKEMCRYQMLERVVSEICSVFDGDIWRE
jgi:hypothetical protein